MLAAYGLGLARAGTRSGGLLAATIFPGLPFTIGLVHSGVSEYLHLWPFPVLLLAAERALSGSRRAAWVAVGAWAWLGWGNASYAMFGAFVVAMAALEAHAIPWRVRLIRIMSIMGLAALFVLPLAAVIRYSLTASDALLRDESAPGWNWVFLPANDLAGFFAFGDRAFPDFRDRGNFGIVHTTYLGFAALAVAFLGIRRWWRSALLAAVLAVGPSLHLYGRPVRVAGAFVPLPAALLYLPGSPFRYVHHPYRLVILPLLVLAGAAAEGLGRRRWALAAAGAVVAEGLWASAPRWPLPLASFSGSAEPPEPGGIWDFPPDFREGNRRWVGLQALHQEPIPYTINVFLPDVWRSNALYQTLMGCLDNPELHTISRDGFPPLAAWLRRDSGQTAVEGLSQVRGWGVRWVALHSVLNERERACAGSVLESAGGEAVPAAARSSEGPLLYDLGRPPG
jgi:hypothetical protein